MDSSKKNTAAQILDSLTNDIISGEFSPQQKLHIKTLKDKYNVGTSPLREALSQLIAKDLVVSENQRGFYVSEISIDDLKDIYQARAKIESLCIDMAIEHGDDYWEASIIAASHRLNKYSKLKNIDLVKEYYGYSNEKAKTVLDILTKDQLKLIKEKLYKGGTK